MQTPVMEYQMGGTLENWMYQVVYSSDQLSTWSGPEGGP